MSYHEFLPLVRFRASLANISRTIPRDPRWISQKNQQTSQHPPCFARKSWQVRADAELDGEFAFCVPLLTPVFLRVNWYPALDPYHPSIPILGHAWSFYPWLATCMIYVQTQTTLINSHRRPWDTCQLVFRTPTKIWFLFRNDGWLTMTFSPVLPMFWASADDVLQFASWLVILDIRGTERPRFLVFGQALCALGAAGSGFRFHISGPVTWVGSELENAESSPFRMSTRQLLANSLKSFSPPCCRNWKMTSDIRLIILVHGRPAAAGELHLWNGCGLVLPHGSASRSGRAKLDGHGRWSSHFLGMGQKWSKHICTMWYNLQYLGWTLTYIKNYFWGFHQ